MTPTSSQPEPSPSTTSEPWDADAEEAALDEAPDRGSRRWWVIGGALVAAAAAVTVWFGVAGTEDTVSSRVMTFTPAERELTVTFEVTRSAGTPVSCTVAALDDEHGSVGTREVTVPASTDRTSQVTTTVRTTTRPANVRIRECHATS